jgi:hypothetical protein
VLKNHAGHDFSENCQAQARVAPLLNSLLSLHGLLSTLPPKEKAGAAMAAPASFALKNSGY